ncbi:ABC transporter ATP-binding protein [Pseudoclavibacter chungangensis]|uniref:ABC transporter ATP-binding protein n=2 Tax=Pseudoclavibacter chungangensis TaxID=587635 RepID=A0A7J5BZM1_9MICO|nr:ABC transporter ATP-binding protein [Pseudoclavibacter chungangensis]KAB1659595.1 ABC transporter ATP-binding protein [Pseudoclavibacter chungangensis]
MQPIFTARGVHKHYGHGASRFEALRGVELDVHEGETLAIVGRSGSGKSTLMHVLALMDRPDGGTLLFEGEDTARLHGAQLDRIRGRSFGFVFQQFFLLPGRPVFDNVAIPLVIAGVSRRERRAAVTDALEHLGIADKAGNRATELSGGQRQRVAIARAIVARPRVVFADEPTGNLDTSTGAQVEDLLFDLNRRLGITLVVITHDAELAERCDRRVHVRDGDVHAAEAVAA